jgi:hypothetical protein
MKNIKFVIGFAASGFLLSFIAGLFSRSGFGHILLMAAVFAVVFGGLAFLIQFLMDGVLNIDAQPAAAESASEQAPKTGSVVDITVQDEDLPAEDNTPQFFVGANHQMLNKNDYSGDDLERTDAFSRGAEQPVPDIDAVQNSDEPVRKQDGARSTVETSADAGFVPLPLQETAASLSGTEAEENTEIKVSAESSGDDLRNLEDDTLDDLPELQDLKPGTADEESVSEDTEFSKAGSPKKTEDKAEVKDAAIMAKAISTILSKDKDN